MKDQARCLCSLVAASLQRSGAVTFGFQLLLSLFWLLCLIWNQCPKQSNAAPPPVTVEKLLDYDDLWGFGTVVESSPCRNSSVADMMMSPQSICFFHLLKTLERKLAHPHFPSFHEDTYWQKKEQNFMGKTKKEDKNKSWANLIFVNTNP